MGARLGSGHPLHLRPHHSWMSPLVWLLEEQNKPRAGHDADFGAQVPHGHLLSTGGLQVGTDLTVPHTGGPGQHREPARESRSHIPAPGSHSRATGSPGTAHRPGSTRAAGGSLCPPTHPGSLAVDQRRSLPSPSTGAGAPDWIFVLPPAGSGPVGSYRVHRCQAAPLPRAPLARSALAALNDFVPVNCSSLL